MLTRKTNETSVTRCRSGCYLSMWGGLADRSSRIGSRESEAEPGVAALEPQRAAQVRGEPQLEVVRLVLEATPRGRHERAVDRLPLAVRIAVVHGLGGDHGHVAPFGRVRARGSGSKRAISGPGRVGSAA